MGEQRVERKLAAILAADVVGYSRLMGTDEEGTLARLKSVHREVFTPPGGVCVSGTVYEHVRDKLSYGFADLGEQRVKNIARPIHVYSFKADSLVQSATASITDSRSPPKSGLAFLRSLVPQPPLPARSFPGGMVLLTFILLGGVAVWLSVEHLVPATYADASQPRGPAVAVLAFDNLSGDPAQEAFAARRRTNNDTQPV